MSEQHVIPDDALTALTATGNDPEALRDKLRNESGGAELYFQEEEAEDGTITMHAWPRTQVMDLIYRLAFPVVRIFDNRAQLKIKSNRAVTDFFVMINSRRSGQFIGQHGRTLDAVETLIGHSVSRRFPRWVNLSVDIDNYRRKRQSFLENMVQKIIREIEYDHKERPVPGLLPKERRFVHHYMTDHPYLTTESRGDTRDTRTLFILPREDIQE
ncbi:MAG: hypothetical protein H7A35_16295 [Planctomycetales bacterium]|nr:hypothetical protein [bacterium]UNM08388.1 MAG: hypothetical protein H7A35_16295 [Planctomycetales bacterium]